MKKHLLSLAFLFAFSIWCVDAQTTVDCAQPPVQINHCYANSDTTNWSFVSSDGSPIRLTFNAGGIESCCDDILVYEGSDNTGTLIYQGNNDGDLSGLTFDSEGDSIYMEIDSDTSVSCASGSGCCTAEWDFTVSCATCINPVATYDVRSDCENTPQFFVDVDVTDLGSAGSITVSDNQASAPQTISAIGLVSFGPFANSTPVVITVANDDDTNCILTSASLTQDFCLDNVVDCVEGSVNTTFCYFNDIDDDPSVATFTYTSSDGSPLNITFNAGQMEGCCDELVVLDSDGTELYNQNNPNPAGLFFQSSGDTISWYINSDGSVSCENNGYTPFDVTVACATCVNPIATYDVRSDCENTPQFFVDVDVTDLGSAGTLTVSDDQGSAPQTISAIGLVSFGPFANSTPVVITVANDDDANCIITSASLTQDYCLDNVVDCTEGPVNTTFCYFNDIDDDPSVATFTYTSSDGSPLNITFNAGQMEGCCDELVVLDSDGTELYNQNTPDPSGLFFQSSGDTISWYINSDGSVSCENNGYTPFDVTVACATCVNPIASYDVRSDCENTPQFFVDVDVTDLGSAGSITLSDNQGSAPQTISAIGLVSFGPFANSVPVVITVANDDDTNCSITSASLTQDYCLDNVVDCDLGPVNTTFCYFNDIDDDPSVATFTYTSSNGLPLNLTFNDGQMEGCCDELVVLDTDGTELYNQNTPDPSGLTFQSSGDTISWYINSDFSVSCENNGYTPFDVTVACATCINPDATYQVVNDCENGDQFLIDVNVTDIGDASSLTISNNFDATTVPVTATGIYQIGPFPFLTDIVVTVSNDQDINCVINSSPIQLLACPPANDNPCNAQVATVNTDDTCDILTPGTIVEATPSGVSDGSCVGDPDDDVWFEFVADNEVQLISLTNIAGGTFNLDHAVYEGTCDNLVELYCSDDDSSITTELVVGNTYFIRVFSGGSTSETSTFDLCIRKSPNNVICENAENLCVGNDTEGALYINSLVGIDDGPSIACLGGTPNPSWTLIEVGESGLIEIQIQQYESFDEFGNPVGADLDVDYVLWGPFDSDTDYCSLGLEVDCPSCPNNTTNPDFYPFGNIVDCSFDGASIENLTIENAIAGEIYVLLITNWEREPGVIQIIQTNSGGGNLTTTINAEIEYAGGGFMDTDGDTLGDLITVCDDLSINPSITIAVDSPFADTFKWYKDGFEIIGENSDTLVVTESDTYQVVVEDEDCEAVAESQIVQVNFYNEAVANPAQDIITCDDASADGFEDFDLSIRTAEILGAQDPNVFTVTYYASLNDANLAVNPLPLDYTNTVPNLQTIYARVEDMDAAADDYLQCRDITQFNLEVSGPTPTATSVIYPECDDDTDGVTLFDLTSQNAAILDGQSDIDFVVSYHESQADADAGIGAIDTSSLYSSTTTVIYVRVESNVAFDCYSTATVDLVVKPLPDTTFTTDFDYEVCPNATVAIQISATANNYNASEVTINWYFDGGLIPGENNLTLDVLEAGLYEIEVTFNDDTQCSNVAEQIVVELPTCVIPQGISPNNDGKNDSFDLSSYDVSKLEIFNRNGTLVYSKTNYTDQWHGQTDDGEELPVGTYFYTMEYENGKRRSAWVYIQRLN